MRRFGLIGYPLSHSFSQGYFAGKFAEEGITDAVYENYPIPGIEEFPVLLATHPDLVGINITIPYKEKVIAYLDELSPEVKAIGACNCIHFANGKRKGYNTDISGFELSFVPHLSERHDHALILGTGGAAKAVAWVLKKLHISFATVSRRPAPGLLTYQDLNDEMMHRYPVIINTTPAGMYPDVDSCPDIPYNALNSSHYLYDLVYNPEETVFLRKGKEKGATVCNGSNMLKLQAEAAWKIWNS